MKSHENEHLSIEENETDYAYLSAHNDDISIGFSCASGIHIDNCIALGDQQRRIGTLESFQATERSIGYSDLPRDMRQKAQPVIFLPERTPADNGRHGTIVAVDWSINVAVQTTSISNDYFMVVRDFDGAGQRQGLVAVPALGEDFSSGFESLPVVMASLGFTEGFDGHLRERFSCWHVVGGWESRGGNGS
jgi:hypothetical protein